MSDKKRKLSECTEDDLELLTPEELAELQNEEEEEEEEDEEDDKKVVEKARKKDAMIKRQAKNISDHNAGSVSGSGSSRSAVCGSSSSVGSVKTPTFCVGGEKIEDFDVAQTLRNKRLEKGEFRMKSANAANALGRQGFYLFY